MKTYVLMISRTYPATHPRKGEETYFVQKIDQINMVESLQLFQPTKLHTIRRNYKLWAKRIKAIQEDKAVLSLRYWSGSPYNFLKDGSKQIEFARLDKDSGIGLQKLTFYESDSCCPYVYGMDGISNEPIEVSELATNDGLSLQDFKAWFRKYDLSEPMGIIHFTGFRY
jgi:hypothetical protein